MVSPARLLGPAAGIVLDRMLGDELLDPHPVALFGTAMARLEKWWWADRRGRGVAHALVGVGVGVAVGSVVRSSVLTTYVVVGGRGLDDAAGRVADALTADDLDLAREQLPWLVGRDPSVLSEAEIARAVVESVAENTVDAVIAPVLWAVAAGPRGALVHRCVNTLDAMIGHRSSRHENFGWASARLDDLANIVPAWIAALLVALVRPRRAGAVIRIVGRDAAAHPSPSGGVIEAAFAAALGRRLGGPVRYGDRHEDRPFLGDGPPADVADVDRARTLARDVDLTLAAILTVAGLVWLRRRRTES